VSNLTKELQEIAERTLSIKEEYARARRLLTIAGELQTELAEKDAHIAALDTALVETSFGARCVENRLTTQLAEAKAETEQLRAVGEALKASSESKGQTKSREKAMKQTTTKPEAEV